MNRYNYSQWEMLKYTTTYIQHTTPSFFSPLVYYRSKLPTSAIYF